MASPGRPGPSPRAEPSRALPREPAPRIATARGRRSPQEGRCGTLGALQGTGLPAQGRAATPLRRHGTARHGAGLAWPGLAPGPSLGRGPRGERRTRNSPCRPPTCSRPLHPAAPPATRRLDRPPTLAPPREPIGSAGHLPARGATPPRANAADWGRGRGRSWERACVPEAREGGGTPARGCVNGDV